MRDSHRLFLRSLMSKQFLSEAETMRMYKKSCEVYGDECPNAGLAQFIEVVNSNLRKLFLEVRRGKSEDDGSTFYGLVNKDQDEHSKMATDFSANDITFFKKAMDLIVASDTGTVSSIDLDNIATDLEKKMSLSYVESLLAKLVKDKWMSYSSGEYSLGPRAMLELNLYLKKVYEDDIVECMMCHEIVIKGQLCHECEGKLHIHCAAKYYRGRVQRTCPNRNCGAAWMHEVPEDRLTNDGSRASAATGDIARRSLAAGPSSSQHRKRKR